MAVNCDMCNAEIPWDPARIVSFLELKKAVENGYRNRKVGRGGPQVEQVIQATGLSRDEVRRLCEENWLNIISRQEGDQGWMMCPECYGELGDFQKRVRQGSAGV